MARCLAEARRPKADYRANQLRKSSPTKEFRLTTVERHRTEGFLPVDDFLAHLKLGLAKTSLQRGAFDEAERRFREVVAEHPQSEPAPEALYWVGVSRCKGKNDARALAEIAQVHDAIRGFAVGEEGIGVARSVTASSGCRRSSKTAR
jgi:hypothetical protein